MEGFPAKKCKQINVSRQKIDGVVAPSLIIICIGKLSWKIG
jgi:hypothetical protein